MKFAKTIAELLPAVQRDHPEVEWIHTTSVTGTYGITASVKDFDEVMDWQEHRRELTQGYYRLIHPPRVQIFKARLEAKYPGFTAVLFCSGPMARKELSELLSVKGHTLLIVAHRELPSVVASGSAHVLTFGEQGVLMGVVLLEDRELAAELHERNRRRGGSISARNVDAWMGEQSFELPGEGILSDVATRLKAMEEAAFVSFYPSGMGAVTAVLDLVLTQDAPRMLVMGNVYRDTHLLLEEFQWAGHEMKTDFLDTFDLSGLAARVYDEDVAGVLIETITNPLIEIPDLPAIAALCRDAGKPLLVDSTMAGPLNACPLALGATVVIHSTSKYLSGGNQHGGGIVLTADPVWMEKLADQQVEFQNTLSPLDVCALAEGIQTYPERLERFNRNGETLAKMLEEHPAVEKVYYGNQGRPEWLKGLASVVSCDLKSATLEKLGIFFDAELPGVIKAPSLGSDQTLFCPYVLLAYYDKSDAYLRACNLSKTLLRFAAGCEEDFSVVLKGIGQALDTVV
ncbi:PLP-dependent transferase [Kiritimatiellaeota bacterium B1221]|nr:PLP-dependent transferase [Kiritimatiellaeota bacterium B1221]